MKPSLLMLPSAVSDSRVHNILPNKIDTDFQFSRASAATRVNHQGLIENVGYFGPELVQNGDFSELGSELVTNGNFATDSDWTKQQGWSINNGKAVAENAGNPTASVFAQPGYSLVIGKTYKVVYTISDYVKGQVRPQFIGGGTSNLPNVSANGTYIEYFVAVNNSTTFRFRAATTDGGFTGSIDNVSVKQVDPDDDWILGTGWSYGDNKINFSNPTGTECFQSLSTTPGIYKISFDLDITSGTVQTSFSSPSTSTIESFTTSGNKNFTITTTANFTRFRFVGLANSVFNITNISVVEVLGDKPRLDYDPLNPTCPHLLLEPQSTNLLPFSEDFSNGWTNQNTIDTANQATSPDGANNGTKLENTTTSSNYIYRFLSPGLSTSTDYSISVFAKKGTSNIVRLDTWDTVGGTQGSARLNLDTETLDAVTGTASFEKYPNDWYKIKVSFTSSGTLGATYYRIFNEDGINGSYIYIFGAQLEQQSYCTSYIPTAGATETRVAETCTNAGNIDTFNSQEGVLYAEIAALSDSISTTVYAISDGSANNTLYVGFNATPNTVIAQLVVGGVGVTNMFSSVSDRTNFNKIAVLFKNNDHKMFINGVQVATDTSGSTPSAGTFDRINFDLGQGSFDFYGKVKSLATYNRALTDNELYTITSTQYSAYSGMVAALGNYTIPC